MKPGICDHCGSRNQQYHDHDSSWDHVALRCFVCGHASVYLSSSGQVERAATWVKEGHHKKRPLYDQEESRAS